MFCIPQNYAHILFKKDYTDATGGEIQVLLDTLRQLPQFSTVGKTVSSNLLRLAELCDSTAKSYRSLLTVSASEQGDALRFLMEQALFGAFLPQLSCLPEMLSLATGFVSAPSEKDSSQICVALDFALTDSLPDLLLKQAQHEAPRFD